MVADAPRARELGSEAKQAAQSPWVAWVARAGLIAQGISYGVVGILALLLALGEGGSAESRTGALQTLAGEQLGVALLVALAVGFASYALWRLSQAIFDREGEGTDAKGLGKRAMYAGKAAIYGYLCVATIDIIGDGRGGGSNEGKQTAGVLDWPAGRWLVLGAGIAFGCVAAYQAYRAFTDKFMEDMKTERMSQASQRGLETLGVVGLLARAIVFGLIGWFLVKAALEYDPDEAVGLDGALAKLTEAPYGPLLLGLTGAGLIAYGLFCAAQARYRRL
jgi:hypothetical protein